MLPTCATSGPGDSGSTWASPGHDYSIPTWSDLILVTLVLTLASSVPGDSGSTWASPGTGDSDPNWASPSSGDSGPHLWTIMSWILCSTPEPHLDMITLDPLWTSP